MPFSTSPDEIVAAFGRVANAIVSGAERDEVLTSLVGSLRQLVDGDVAAIALRLPDGDLEILAAEGVDAEVYLGQRFAPTGTESGHVMSTGETVAVENISARYSQNPSLPSGNPGPAVFVPVRVDGPDGALALLADLTYRTQDWTRARQLYAKLDAATGKLTPEEHRRLDEQLRREALAARRRAQEAEPR